jgi:hypothetical protein
VPFLPSNNFQSLHFTGQNCVEHLFFYAILEELHPFLISMAKMLLKLPRLFFSFIINQRFKFYVHKSISSIV